MATIAKYKVYNGTSWEEYYFTTSADAVIETSSKKFLAASEKTAITALAALSDTGFVKKTSSGWSVDTSTYLKSTDNLDATKLVGKVPIDSIPDSVLGQLEYKGTFNASTASGITGLEKGWYYICSADGNKNPDGTTNSNGYKVGDWAVYNGSSWDKVGNTDAISSWCGLTGAITASQAKSALAGSISSSDQGFVYGGEVYDELIQKADLFKPEFKQKIRIRAASDSYINNYAELEYYAVYSGSTPSANNGLIITAGVDGEASDVSGNIYLNPLTAPYSQYTGKAYYKQSPYDTLDPDKEIATKGDISTITGNALTKVGTLQAREIPTVYVGSTTGKELSSSLVFIENDLIKFRHGQQGSYALRDGGISGSSLKIIADAGTYESSNVDGWIRFVGKGFLFQPDSEQSSIGYNGKMGEFRFGIYNSTKDRWLLTDNREYVFPDKDGTVAMTNDIPTVTKSSTAPTGAKAGDIWFDTSN